MVNSFQGLQFLREEEHREEEVLRVSQEEIQHDLHRAHKVQVSLGHLHQDTTNNQKRASFRPQSSDPCN